MKILGEIQESNISENELGKLRQAVRLVLFDKDKNIAIGHYLPNKDFPNGTYNLPGGGVKENEDINKALIREAKEETGCNLTSIQELGIIKEYGVGKETKHNQDTYCFKAEIDGEKETPEFTEREVSDNLKIEWLPIDKVIEKIKNQDETISKSRNLIILEKIKLG